MELTERKLGESSGVRATFATGRFSSRPWQTYEELLVVRFESGETVNHEDIHFMETMVLASSVLWLASAVVIDLRDLNYEWGDTMDRVLFNRYCVKTPPHFEKIFPNETQKPDVPRAVVISDLNRAAFETLLEQECKQNPDAYLFNSIEDAVAALEFKLRKEFNGI